MQGSVSECTGGGFCLSGHRVSARCETGLPLWVTALMPRSRCKGLNVVWKPLQYVREKELWGFLPGAQAPALPCPNNLY